MWSHGREAETSRELETELRLKYRECSTEPIKQGGLQSGITGLGVTHLKSLPYLARMDWPPAAWGKRL